MENEQKNTAEQEAQEVKTPARNLKDLVQLGVTAAMALYSFFVTLNMTFEWFTPESINAFGVFALAILTFAGALWTGWRNTYTTKKGLERAAAEIDKSLKK